MSEEILKALVQLFALIAFPNKENNQRREIVKVFLNNQLNSSTAEAYLKLYEEHYQVHAAKLERLQKKDPLKPSLTANSVKALRIAKAINKELTHFQKLIVTIRLIEFLKKGIDISSYERDFIKTVSESFNISNEEFLLIEHFVVDDFSNPFDNKNILLVNKLDYSKFKHSKHLNISLLQSEIQVANITSGNVFLLKAEQETELTINGQLANSDRIHVIKPGSSVRVKNLEPIYYSDIVNKFNTDNLHQSFNFEAKDISYLYPNNNNGIQKMSFQAECGNLVGIMGSSGAGKSTLINVLSGINSPQSGTVSISGIDINKEKEKVNGLIGYVSQDDLLMEELTVYQNLYYNAKLCFDSYSEFHIKKKVLNLLNSLGLFETKDMVVGSPLNKKISGGQRKRLNIALELIREPAVLFLDEPTSGLSSRDSENIIDLLKELSLKGKLVFVVIHQPSSDIFKMFNQLLVVDTGGYLAYEGDPIESINYFKSNINLANREENECSKCGNVNPEQILNIISANVVDEYGSFTQKRKREPKEWYDLFKSKLQKTNDDKSAVLPSISFKIPNKLKQFLVFVKRDVLSKISNTQYLLINLIETPILALILATIIKYYNIDETTDSSYVFQNNPNIIVYIIMAVIIAIFVGLTVSAEEIIRDKKILKREKFLNLSRLSYLLSKVFILSIISAIQTLLFVVVGNSIIELKGLFWEYWIILFSCSIFANLLGLNISDSFKNAVNIYITIPFLIIPQIILSGVFISYDKLNPKLSDPDIVPWFGEIITARWAFEALSVDQFINNKYERNFYVYDKIKSKAQFKKEFWIPLLEAKVTAADKAYTNKNTQLLGSILSLIQDEIIKEEKKSETKSNFISLLNTDDYNNEVSASVNDYLEKKKGFYKRLFNNTDIVLDQKRKDIIKASSIEDFNKLKRDYTNTELNRFVTNSNDIFTNKIIEHKNRLIQKSDPIYKEPEPGFIKAHFLSPFKRFGNLKVDTLVMNTIIIWLLNITLFITLYFGFTKYIINKISKVCKRN
ncbi:ATP-binding cassette domain-containing protein [Saccharicrinis aurantiacus]|uniref:ATP-binding cassette domain-containing protein n=1 Tax=Saccharicrinis aurantiacus TaxID=1849719 RepID=UPI00248F48B0|nr:ATP-binding cassette domain-containing protein [Saccharicrinis aurantiacus]